MIANYEIATLLTVVTTMSLWVANRQVFYCLLAITLLTALILGSITVIGLAVVLILLGMSWAYANNVQPWWLLFALLVVLGLALGTHAVLGFNNHQFIESHQLSATAATFSVWFNYDKAFFGVLVLSAVFHQNLIKNRKQLYDLLQAMLPIVLVGIPAVYLIAVLMGYSEFDVTFSSVFIPWAIKNLFFTVIAEEMMFRGLLQRELSNRIRSPNAAAYGILIAGFLFGLAHFAGGIEYVFLSTVAGILYGFAYFKTGRIEAAITTHFLLNAGHFLFFSYPYLRNAV